MSEPEAATFSRGPRDAITDVVGIRVGHHTDLVALTGCTVLLPPPGAAVAGELRGGAPATRETALLRPGMTVLEAHAIVLTGGSAFGLAAADGVMRWLEEQEIGLDTSVVRVPIVPTAALFDLSVGNPLVRPTSEDGYAAANAAATATATAGADGADVAQGNVGAGTGATVAKEHGLDRVVKGGLGTASFVHEGVVVGALVAVNAVGEIFEADGTLLAGARTEEGEGAQQLPMLPGTNTVIGVIATNATLNRERGNLLALAGHEGISDAVRPSHTPWDGDVVFTLATGQIGEVDQRLLESLAQAAMAAAIRNGVRAAEGVPGAPKAGAPKAGAPKAGAPKAGAPKAGAPKAGT